MNSERRRVDDLDTTLERLKEQGIEPEREPYAVCEGGSRLCFVQDPDRLLPDVECTGPGFRRYG